jgi:glycine hydroxymethyltransferase
VKEGYLLNDNYIIEYANSLKRLAKNHEEWRTTKTLNLMASENFASPQARYFLSTDLSNRYAARDHFYRGTRYTDEIESMAVDVAKKLFGAKFADVRPISGHTCSLILFLSFLKAGNKVVTCPPKYGGYPGSSDLGLGTLLSLRNLYFPYDPELMNIIPVETRALLHERNPEMTVFGSSFIPFPYDIGSSVPPDYQGVTAYDGSHVMGLIAGGEFQSPLSEGCSVLMGSTHKSLFGPQGGLILSNDQDVFSVIDSKVHPGIVDNIHWNRVASLTYAMLELTRWGKKYAKQVVSNSQTLARSLNESGIPVKCASIGFTKSHQVLLGYGEKKSVEVADRLQEVDMICDVGIRLGTSEVTRRGMKEGEMERIASLIVDALNRKTNRETIRRQVHKLVREFGGIVFTLN